VNHSSAISRRSPDHNELEKLIVTAHREPAAIVHELLHLKLTTLGFPVQFGEGAEDSIFADQITCLQNSISHAIFLNDFLAVGFSRMQLAWNADIPDDIPKFANFLYWLVNQPGPRKHRRGVFNRLYFEQLIASRMGMPNSEGDFLREGSARFSTAEGDARWMATWFERGDFRNPILFPKAMNQMFEQIGLRPVRWYRVDLVAGHLALREIL
jgi:hypothetical protein